MSEPEAGESALVGHGVGSPTLRALLAQDCDWYWETDAALRVIAVRATGRGSAALEHARWRGRPLWEMPGELVEPKGWDEVRRRLDAYEPFSGLVLRVAAAGRGPVTVQHCGVPAFRPDGSFTGYVGIARDVSDQHRAQDTLARLASVDPLTRLLNRAAFDERAQQALADAYARGRQCALLCIGLDRFQALNRIYGYRVGDRMLSVVADRLGKVVRAPHFLGRRGGEEIVALMVDLPDADVALRAARAAVDAVVPAERLDQIEVSVSAAAGVAYFPKDGGDLDELLNAAEAALAGAREAGGRRAALYTPELARRTELRVRLEQRLRRAYESRDFRLFYQPLVSLPEGRLVGAEALLRWKDAELGDIEPGEFIPIAEESGLIDGVGDWVLREACRQRQLWRQAGLDLPPIAVNVSGVQLRKEDFVGFVLSTLDEFEVAAEELEIEITETGLMDAPATSRDSLARLRNAGIKAALDDFGVGYSSLAHLRDLPMHRLKIDRSFTVDCMRDARTLTIVKSVIDMAHSLGLVVTAEGIETPEQKDWMHHLGCDSAQGYLFARPLPAEQFLQRFLEGRSLEGARSH